MISDASVTITAIFATAAAFTGSLPLLLVVIAAATATATATAFVSNCGDIDDDVVMVLSQFQTCFRQQSIFRIR